MANDLEFGVKVNGVASAISDVGRVTSANEQAGRAARTAGTASAASANAARAAFAGLGSAATSAGQRVGQTATAVGQMTSAFSALTPTLGRSGSIISQLGGTMSALTGAMGPMGLALGAVTAAASAAGAAFAAQDAAMESSRVHARALTQSLQELITVQRQQRSDAAINARLNAGGGTADEQLAFQQQSQNRVSLLTRALSGDAGALAELRGSGQLASTRTSLTLTERLTTGRLGQGESGEGAGETRQLEAMLQSALRENAQRIELIGVAAENLGQQAADLNARTDAQIARRARGGGGGGGGGGARSEASREEAAFMRDMASLTRELAAAEAERAAALDLQKTKAIEAIEAEAEARRHAADMEKLQLQQAADDLREKADAQKELAEAGKASSLEFGRAWRGTLDDVVSAFHAANDALKEAGEDQLSTARLMEVGMHSVANSIADAVGGTLVGAFKTAVDAWLDGSLTFVEAAEAMVKGVLKSLVSEAIVQGVVELARAVASAASYDMPGAALHLGAAAAWAAVGAAAGAVGAGIGAFGGGASKGGAAAGAALPQATAQDSQRPAGNTVINVYPGGFVTRGEVVAGVYEAINEGGRMGMQFDGAAVGA